MSIDPNILEATFWESCEIHEEDLEFLYNHLLDIETPQTSAELVRVFIDQKIRREVEQRKNNQGSKGKLYRPQDSYQAGDRIRFPALEWESGEVVSVREGQNPDHNPFKVISVTMETGEARDFASELDRHKLNQVVQVEATDPGLDSEFVYETYGELLIERLTDTFKGLPDLVQIAGAWFPRSLLVDVNIGHLNLAEAVLEVAGGGPLETKSILEQIELPTDVNLKLTEFSMNLALQEDERFDEVGPSGDILWFLKRLEPEEVKNPPNFLKFQPPSIDAQPDPDQLRILNQLVFDELEPDGDLPRKADQIEVSLIFPHWRSGTIPLSRSIARLFPTAYEAPRVQFTFIDLDTDKEYPGWVVRPHRYVVGLKDWYQEKGLIPGSLFNIKAGKKPGQVGIQALSKRTTKEWIRTILVGADGGIVFTMLKQQINNEIDDRMAIAVPDAASVDQLWEQHGRYKGTLEKTILSVMRELVKLSPQGHVHAQELYAGINIIRRCPPGVLLGVLSNQTNVIHLGDLYYKLGEQESEE